MARLQNPKIFSAPKAPKTSFLNVSAYLKISYFFRPSAENFVAKQGGSMAWNSTDTAILHFSIAFDSIFHCSRARLKKYAGKKENFGISRFQNF